MSLLSSLITTLIILSITVYSQRSEETLTKCGDMGECADIANLTNLYILCSGKVSCTNSNITTPRPKDGEVKCSGKSSCREAAIFTAGKKDTYCSGYQSCLAATSINSRIVTCNGASSCGFIKDDGATITATREVICGGDYACQNQEPMQSEKKVTCSGSNGCVLNTLYSDGDIDCGGARSCAFSMLMAQGTVSCAGRESCQHSTITAANGVLLHGDVAAFKTTITDTPYVYVYGGNAFDESTIDSGSLSMMTVKMLASSMRSSGTSIICRRGAECNLVCDTSGCIGIMYECERGATCSIEPAECATNPGGEVDGITCPSMTKSLLSDLREDFDVALVDNAMKEDDNNESLKGYDTTSCIAERECESFEFGAGDGSKLLCEGSASCQGATIRDRTTECNGESSCRLVDITDAMGPYCDGALSCSNAINMISSSSIYCYGESACQRSSMHSEVMVECRGASSCYKSDIVMPAGYYTACYGDMSCYGASITNGDTASILCRGASSCEEADLVTSYEGMDYGSYYAVQCFGENSCKNAKIVTSGTYSKIHFAGLHSGEGAQVSIRGTEVIVTGYRGLRFGTIDSEDSTELMVNLYGKQAMFRGAFICRRGSICHLKCKGDSCLDVDYLCEKGATCYVNPSGCQDGARTVGNYVCPSIESVEANYDMTDIIEQKKIEMKSFKSISLFESFDKINVAKQNSNDKLLSFDIYNEMNQELLLAMIAILGFIGFITYYVCNKVRNNEQYKILN